MNTPHCISWTPHCISLYFHVSEFCEHLTYFRVSRVLWTHHCISLYLTVFPCFQAGADAHKASILPVDGDREVEFDCVVVGSGAGGGVVCYLSGVNAPRSGMSHYMCFTWNKYWYQYIDTYMNINKWSETYNIIYIYIYINVNMNIHINININK